jgi:nitroimidazol reductase NimA-like FMN-containing flavoprotein (pyridoxamine 5'-phosphate oxidase superfamily)
MSEPVADRPRMFGGVLEPVPLPWSWAEAHLVDARHYWIATSRPDGRPHCRPVWAVWVEGAICFSTGSQAATNLVANPAISVQVETDAGEAVIVEGTATEVTDPSLLERIVDAYNPKYRSDMDPDALPGAFWAVRPHVVFAWISDPSGADAGAAFHGTATKWTFG